MNTVLLALSLGFLHFCLGGLWYSPLAFGQAWMRGLGITQADIHEARINMKAALGASAVASIGQAVTLVVLVAALPVGTILQGALIGAGIAAAFSFLPMLKDRVWADRPWIVVIVDAGYEVLAAAVVGAIAAWWFW